MWFYVAYQENPTMSKTVKNVPLAITGEQALKENGFAVYKISDTDVDVKVTGKRNIIARNTKKTLSAVINVSAINHKGEYTLSPTVNGVSAGATYYVKGKDIKVIVEPIVEKSFTIKADIADSGATSLKVRSSALTPSKVTVSAPESIANDILEVRTEQIVPTDETEILIKDVNLIVIGKNGKPVEWAECSPSSVDVSCEYYKMKSVPVMLKTSDGKLHSLPSKNVVNIYGYENFDDIKYIETEVVNLAQHTSEESIKVKLNIPKNVKLTVDTNEIEIELKDFYK
jgi:hypothetical protein